MKKINLIIQPTHNCNLHCKYCYDKKNSNNTDKKIISLDYLEKMFKICSKEYELIHCIWLGGEPTIFGIENFIRAINLQKKINEFSGAIFSNSMETNALYFKKNDMKILKDNNFSIGMSFDGINNILSRNVPAETMIKIIDDYKKSLISTSCIYVLNKYNFNNIIEDYYFFNEHEVNMKINSCFYDRFSNEDLSISSDEYVTSMFSLFKLYYTDKTKKIHINPFDEYIEMIKHNKAKSCHFGSCLCKNLCIDSYGNIFPCGRYNKKICNITDVSSVSMIYNNKNYLQIIEDKRNKIEKCKQCDLFYYCGSGCTYNCEKGNKYCLEFKKLFIKIKDYILNGE